MLSRELMGLNFDEDTTFRRELSNLGGTPAYRSEIIDEAYPFRGWFRPRELKFVLSQEPPDELLRRILIEHFRQGKLSKHSTPD
jgi:hypothetical protein